MKVLLIASLATSALVAMPAQAAGDSGKKHHDHADYGPAMGADRGIYDFDGPGLSTYSDASGVRYEYDGAWTKGQYLDPEGRVYEGQWNGKVTRTKDGAAPAPMPRHPMPPHPMPAAGAPYDVPQAAPYPMPPAYGAGFDNREYEKCLKSDGVGGAAIGAILGAIAGNRIAGRGNRTEGTLIGSGLGALAGLGVEKSMKKCEKYLSRDNGYGPVYGHAPRGYPYGYYYYPAPMVAYSMVPVTTTTVTEEIYYETVPVKRKAVRKWKPKPKPKPRCVCR
ncbi:MAG: glycine zipper 2TM domain-containing protein [Sphingomonadales bacterium]|nr:glycine zipper 2TM domain-containing protein [Sphingomonadales bacterium]